MPGPANSDRLALDAIATLDPEYVYDTVRRNRISMCGMAGLRGRHGDDALAGLPAPLRKGRLRHQRRGRRADGPRRRLRGTAV